MVARQAVFLALIRIPVGVSAFTPSNPLTTRPLRLPWARAYRYTGISSASPSLRASTESRSQEEAISGSSAASLYGGDYAGLSATFSGTNGDLIPVPEHLVPDTLLEWGAAPNFLEVITSEKVEESEGGEEAVSLERQTVTVFPDVGCGVDNLDTMQSEDRLQLFRGEVTAGNDGGGRISILDHDVVALDYPLPRKQHMELTRVETTFRLENQSDQRRIRVLLDVACADGKLQVQTPVTIVMERQTSPNSSGGIIADGGGLDGRTVTRLLGDIESHFAQGLKKQLDLKDMAGSWKRAQVEAVEEHVLFDTGNTGNVFAGNVIVMCRSEPSGWLDVVHVSTDQKSRTVVRRYCDLEGELVGDAKRWTEAITLDGSDGNCAS